MSPKPRPFSTGMPAARCLICLPDWIPAGMRISCAVLSSPGTVIVPPSAAVVNEIGHRANNVLPSRWNSACRARWMKM